MARRDHGHAVFEDGHEVEFGWVGWPRQLAPSDDTPNTKAEREFQRRIYVEQLARYWAGEHYAAMKVVRLWLAG